MKQKLYRVYGSSLFYWSALVKANNKEEAKSKSERGEIEDWDDNPRCVERVVGDAEEVNE